MMCSSRTASKAGISQRLHNLKCRHEQRLPQIYTITPWTYARSHHIRTFKAASHSYPDSGHSSSKQAQYTANKQARAFPLVIVVSLLLGSSIYYLATPSCKTLNATTFVPYTITSRDAISPTSFILTVVPQTPNPSPPYLSPASSAWRHNLWSVEFKQPEVQIARHYTPLPPLDGDTPVDGRLRFYLRAVDGGEMSNYLRRLSVGSDVWLRGPHPGFDIARRLGERKHVVFLAGGTGVVPGMQAATAVLDGSDTTQMTLLWAIRRREELQHARPKASAWWLFGKRGVPEVLDAGLDAPSPITRQLSEMKVKYGDRLRIQVAIDEEYTSFQESDILNATKASSGDAKSPSANHTLSSKGCHFHNQRVHELSSDFDVRGDDDDNCKCVSGADTPPGKNLLMVSGPDGFISRYAGPKVWLGGRQTQGPVGGVAAELLRRQPDLSREWLVLKL